jgi:hypothetical protein
VGSLLEIARQADRQNHHNGIGKIKPSANRRRDGLDSTSNAGPGGEGDDAGVAGRPPPGRVIQSSRAPGGRASSGIGVAAMGLKANPAAAAPNRIPRANPRRSINSIRRFLPKTKQGHLT